ncbi:MAG: homoserine kinase [Rothia sp. (in: high G+C Gram-positive bacteria)]|nr:homoserine kinase [Rothia sp. (in: high G+C Gram-positive bacteria)]
MSLPMIDGSNEPLIQPHDIPVGARVTVKVPASSANLGPGYDSLGLALAYYDDLTVTRIPGVGELTFDLTGEGAHEVPQDASHLVVRAMVEAWKAAGLLELPSLHIQAHNRIPHSRGMGSSASAIVAGVSAANGLLPAARQLDAKAVLQVCSGLEGHPDNVAPSLYGQVVISYGDESGWHSLPVPAHPEVLPVIAIPDYEVPTKVARELIPQTVSHRDAAANSGRAALLTQALASYPEYLLPATSDLLHQPYRAVAMKPSASLVAYLRDQGFAAVISGAGPTVMALAKGADERARVRQAIEAFATEREPNQHENRPVSWRVLDIDIDTKGVMLTYEETA